MATTWNPADVGTNITLSNGNLTAAWGATTGYTSVRSTNSPAKTAGKWHAEFTIPVMVVGVPLIGLMSGTALLTSFAGHDAQGIGADTVNSTNNLQVFQNNVAINTYTLAVAQGDIFAIEVDIPNKLVWWYDITQRSGWTNASNTTFTGNPGAGTGGTTFTLTTTSGVMLAGSGELSDATIIVNPGPIFALSPSVGFSSWDGTFTPVVVTEDNYRRVRSGATFVFMPRAFRDEPIVPISKLGMQEPFPQFGRKHTAPTRAWARLDEQFMPTWNAVLIPTLQSWELPIQFVKSLFGQSKSQPDVPSFVATPLPAQLIPQGAPRLMGQSKSQPDVPSFVAAPVVQQPYGFDVIAQGASRVLWQPKAQSETPSFIPQLSILDSIIQFTSRLLSRRLQAENPTVIPVTAAPRTDLELFPRRLITTERPIPIDLVNVAAPVAPTMAFDREQFPARLEFTPRLQQFESFIIIIATQVLQLTLAAWKWVAQSPSLTFTLTGSLVAWIWKAQASILAQTMTLALVAWLWKPFAALFVQTIVATHAVWKWLPQSAILLLSLGFSAPGVVWRWLAQAPGLFFPIILQTTTAVWLWVGRALAGGTHFAKVTYGLLLQVGRLRNR